MKTILCFGDSNTWGADSEHQCRFPRNIRWPCRLRRLLGAEYEVIEEGQPGRTTLWDDPIEQYKNGLMYLCPCLESHAPIDMVVLMIGTNDLKLRFSVNAYDVAEANARLIQTIYERCAVIQATIPKVLLIRPPSIGPGIDGTRFRMFDYAHSHIQSTQSAPWFESVAQRLDCLYLDADQVSEITPYDHIHLSEKGHKLLADAVVRTILDYYHTSSTIG